MQKFKVSGQLVPTTEWKQTDGQTDRRTDGCDCITSLANAVGNKSDFLLILETLASYYGVKMIYI